MKLFSKSLFVAVAVAAAGAAAPASAENVRLMTGPQGGSWVPLGGQLKDMWEKAVPGLAVQALPGAGIANVRGVQDGKTEIGFGNSISTVDALAGNAPFNTPHTNVCNVATLYPQYFQVIVPADSGINSIKDLKGKSISTQPRGNTGEQIARDILKVNGLNYDSVKTSFVSYTDSVTQMKDGHAQAFMLGTTIPAGSIMDVAAGRDIKLLDLSANLNDMRKINPGYTLVNVPANTYPKQTADVKVIGYATHIVASCKLPEKTVYEMTKAMAANTSSMASIVKAMANLTVKEMGQDIGVPFHPGAAKFYKEKGVSVKAM